MTRMLAIALALLVVAPSTAQAERRQLTVEEQYELGLKYMKRGYYVKALEQFNRIRNYHRDDPYAVQAELAIADLYYKKTEWDQARVAYEDFLRLHPRHEDIDYVVFRLGMTSFKKAPRIAARDQTWTRQAVNTWTGFDTRFSGSEHQPEVTENLVAARNRLARKELLIARFYAKQRQAWPAVIARAEGMLQRYPDSPDAPEALMWVALARDAQGDPSGARDVAQRLQQDHPEARSLRRLERKAPHLFEAAAASAE